MPNAAAARISVACPCFNDGATITETVDSIRENEPVDVVIVDDGSSDPATLAVLEALEQRAEVTVVRHPRNLGVPRGINTALASARTPFVFFIGADDLVEPGALADLADALEAAPDAVAAWGTYEYFGDRTGHRTVPPFDPWRVTYNNYWPGVAMVRRERLLELGGASERSAYEDWDMWMSVAQAGGTGVVIDRPMFRYRIHQKGVRRCAVAKDGFPGEYRAMRVGHEQLFARRRELVAASTLTPVQRARERAMLRMKLMLPKHVRRVVYGTAAWLETRRHGRVAT